MTRLSLSLCSFHSLHVLLFHFAELGVSNETTCHISSQKIIRGHIFSTQIVQLRHANDDSIFVRLSLYDPALLVYNGNYHNFRIDKLDLLTA